METTGSVPRLRKREFFASLGYEPHAGQILVHKSKAPRRVLACGVRWGKSTCGAMEGIAALFDLKEQSLGWIVCPTYSLGDRIFLEISRTITEHLSHRIIELSEREQRIVVRNFGGGVSELRVKSADNPTSLLGQALDYAIIDEAARLKADVWERHVSQRLLDRKGWALLLSTPANPNWFYRMFRRGQKSRDAMFESWSSPTWTNPFVDPEFVEAERARIPPDTFRAEYGGEFVGTETEPCDTCHGPSPTACSTIVVQGYPTIPTCRDCGRPVDENGNTRVTIWGGKEHFSVIHLMERSGDLPLLPFDSEESRRAYEARAGNTQVQVLTGVENP